MDLPPPVIDNSQEQYIVDYSTASEDDLYAALIAPPVEALERDYSLEAIRLGFWLRERMRRVDLPDINFEFGSWEIAPDQYPKLERLARVIKRILDRRPDEVFLVEGHTDVVDSDIDNLTLSDRRAEAVAFILSQMFGVPAENLVTQGYGGQYLKAETGEPAGANRRVTVRRITPLLHREGPSVALGPDDRAPPGTSLPGSLALSDEDRAFILANVDLPGEPRLGIGGISEGMPVPGGARLRSFPSVVRERIPSSKRTSTSSSSVMSPSSIRAKPWWSPSWKATDRASSTRLKGTRCGQRRAFTLSLRNRPSTARTANPDAIGQQAVVVLRAAQRRSGPIADSCTAAKHISIRSPHRPRQAAKVRVEAWGAIWRAFSSACPRSRGRR